MDTMRRPRFAVWNTLALCAGLLAFGCGGYESADDAKTAEKKSEKVAATDADNTPAFGNTVAGDGEAPRVTQTGDVAISKHPPGMSEALPTEVMRMVNMDDEEVQFDKTTLGRKIQEINAFAVEMTMFGVMGNDSALYTYAQMESLDAAGALEGKKTFARFNRAIIHGDRDAVAKAVAAGDVNWFLSPRDESYPHNGINKQIAAKSHEGHNH